MSALSLISNYGNISSEESDSESEKIPKKRQKLPPPNLDKVSTVQTEEHKDNPALHTGRVRSFPHVRGNWATFVYVNCNLTNTFKAVLSMKINAIGLDGYPDEDIVTNLINKLKSLVLTIDDTCLICDDIHLSLSRTVVLHYHLISAFTSSLQESLCNINRFNIQFDSVEVYCNDEGTRTFIALKVDHCSEKFLLNITKKVDNILEDLKLPPFYKDPSFHSSILWANGNKRTKFEGIKDRLNDIVRKDLVKNLRSFLIDRIHCKIGYKQFQYYLK